MECQIDVPDKMPENMTDRKSNRMPDDLPNKMSDRMH